ncbi:hypothetical protein [Tellurirhabdus rosea]|uniref:hypothetical protein n=1 Tax=Tellurirhabdus rosea TaxID=2674997 RepID=UPI002256CFCE|nr:hypothetical protein [Tellurirhabdus rosea]
MLKKITLPVPRHLKKFLEGEYGVTPKGVIHVEKWSEVGRLIHLASRVVPFPIKAEKPSGTTVTISYYCREKAYDVPPEKLKELVLQLEEIFRRSLIFEVRKVHELTGQQYGRFVTDFLDRYGIVADEDIEWQTVRKVYRDYLDRINKQNQKIYA